MSDEQKSEKPSDDNGNIEGGPTGIKIPVRRSDVGPYVKWIILAIAFGIAVLCVGGAVRLAVGGL